MSTPMRWLALTDLRRDRRSTLLTAVALGLGVFSVAFFAGEVGASQARLGTTYQAQGAATFVVELNGLNDTEAQKLAAQLKGLTGVDGVDAPDDGIPQGIAADTYFLVFQNAQQKEYLGVRTIGATMMRPPCVPMTATCPCLSLSCSPHDTGHTIGLRHSLETGVATHERRPPMTIHRGIIAIAGSCNT